MKIQLYMKLPLLSRSGAGAGTCIGHRTDFSDIAAEDVTAPYWVVYTDNRGNLYTIQSPDDLAAVLEGLDRAATWKPEIKENKVNKVDTNDYLVTQLKKPDAINPSHYQGFMVIQDGNSECHLQWLEAQQYHVRYRDKPGVFCGAIELQVRKYLDRNGGKDDALQETEKALWYLKFLTAFIKNGYQPIRVADIESILSSKRDS